ncbi:MAG TPA: hypothetical protein VKD28_10755 [Gemmatimonadales bacterium]|nr:hypothetical protein [Gemmatimonadales bacterium]
MTRPILESPLLSALPGGHLRPRLLEDTGKGLRHVRIRSLAEADRPPVRALVAESLARRRSGATGRTHT